MIKRYEKTQWIPKITKVSATNLNKIENQLDLITNEVNTKTSMDDTKTSDTTTWSSKKIVESFPVVSQLLNKEKDKAYLTDFHENNDSKYITPKTMLFTFKDLESNGNLSLVSSVNGKLGNVIITKEDMELENVTNDRQATKEEFEAHANNGKIHLTQEQYQDIIKKNGEIKTAISKKIDKSLDKATIEDAQLGSDNNKFMTPLTVKKSIDKIVQDAGGVEYANYVLSINGKSGENIILTREDLELDQLINKTQATKEEFDLHTNNKSIHFKSEEKDLIMNNIGEIKSLYSNSLQKTKDKATFEEMLAGKDDTKYATPLGLKELVDEALKPFERNILVYELKDYGFNGIIANILKGQTYYSNKEITIGDLSITPTSKIAEKTIEINSTDCASLTNAYLFVK